MAKIVATAEETKATANKVQRIIMDDGFFGTELFGDMVRSKHCKCMFDCMQRCNVNILHHHD
jgi:hypothetical protein